MKSLTRIRWALACLIAPLIVAFHRLGKPAGFEAYGAIKSPAFSFSNLMSHDDEPGWKVSRYPFAAAGGPALSTMKPGYLLKFDATRANVNPALAADDALLEAVLIDLPTDAANPTDVTVGVAFNGSFDKNQIKYADGTTPLSAAAVARLRDMEIFLDPAVPTGPTSP
jgi:hypothetical protein